MNAAVCNTRKTRDTYDITFMSLEDVRARRVPGYPAGLTGRLRLKNSGAGARKGRKTTRPLQIAKPLSGSGSRLKKGGD